MQQQTKSRLQIVAIILGMASLPLYSIYDIIKPKDFSIGKALKNALEAVAGKVMEVYDRHNNSPAKSTRIFEIDSFEPLGSHNWEESLPNKEEIPVEWVARFTMLGRLEQVSRIGKMSDSRLKNASDLLHDYINLGYKSDLVVCAKELVDNEIRKRSKSEKKWVDAISGKKNPLELG